MKTSKIKLMLLSCVAGLSGMAGILSAASFDEPKPSDRSIESAKSSAATTDGAEQSGVSAPGKDTNRVPISVARDRARLMHSIYSTTLGVMHDRYFHADRSIVPARAMEDVFSGIEQETGSKANWISVNLKAMSINHEPSTEF